LLGEQKQGMHTNWRPRLKTGTRYGAFADGHERRVTGSPLGRMSAGGRRLHVCRGSGI
jgi:hypothetical protein